MYSRDFQRRTERALDYNKIKIGVKNLEDAILNVGSYNTDVPQPLRINKPMIFKAIAENDIKELHGQMELIRLQSVDNPSDNIITEEENQLKQQVKFQEKQIQTLKVCFMKGNKNYRFNYKRKKQKQVNCFRMLKKY